MDFGDLGLTRNHGVSKALAPIVAFVDADNLIGANWLFQAHSFLMEWGGDCVVHPEFIVLFDAESLVRRQISSNNPGFRSGNLMENNYWDAACAAKIDVLRRVPYQATMVTRGYGYEDWHFNCETIGYDIPHYVVPNTVFFLRKKRSGSLLSQTNRERRIVRSSVLFRPDVFRRLNRPSLSSSK